MVRTSTIKQSIEDQHNEMIGFLKGEGYKESEIEWVETQGASAAKADDAYLAMIAKVKTIIESNNHIQALAVWHLNRAFRTEDHYVDLKKYLVSHKVNLLCKNPYVRLLTPDGKVDKGMELAAGLLAILAKQDQEERVEKFARAKRANAAKGKFNGGTPKFGYTVDENGFVVPNEVEAEIVRKIYELYATGTYSAQTLAIELSERGITKPNRRPVSSESDHQPIRPFDPDTIVRILNDTAYIGYTDSDRNRSHRVFPPILDEGIWKQVEEVRMNNYKDIPRTGQVYLANKIIVCPECGGNLHIDNNHYQCWRHNSHSTPARRGNRCSYALHPPARPTHNLLWTIASDMHVEHLLSMSIEDASKYKEKLETIEKKITTLEGKKEALQRKKKKVVDSYIEELISKDERDDKLAKITNDARDLEARIKSLQAEQAKLSRVINQLNSFETYTNVVRDIALSVLREREASKMYEIIHTYILSCTVTRTQFGTPDPRSKRPNALEYHVKCVDGYTYKFLYLPCCQKEFKWYGWDGRKWSPTMVQEVE